MGGVNEVIVAHVDPNPTVRGSGLQALEAAGIKVAHGLLQSEASEQMRPFLHWCTHRRPLVTVKLAVDINGSVDDRSDSPKRFTSSDCLDAVHALRKECDAILVGVETVVRDDLTVRRITASVVLDQTSTFEAVLLNDGLKHL